jgi:Exopolysaccharide biosynthesis protein YbjH
VPDQALLARPIPARPSLGGMTGLLNTPTAEVTADGEFHLGYDLIAKDASYEGRGVVDNRIYFLTMGFLPNLEASIRATVLPGQSQIPEVRTSTIDRMGSARYRILPEKKWPALAIGMDDVRGTRRYHSFYLVATKGFEVSSRLLSASFSGGRGFRTFRAGRYLLDGTFGGADIILGNRAFFIVEYDSEKWNGGIRLCPFPQLTAQLAFLDFDTPSGGVAWTHRF